MSDAPQPARPGFYSVDDYLALPRDRATWLLRPLLPISGAALIYSAEKQGKSFLAIQLALALSGQSDNWLGFPVIKSGPVLYLQLDTPRSVWAYRFDELISKGGISYDNSTFKLADRECLEYYPFDILQPQHVEYLFRIIRPFGAVAVIIDTLREAHSGDEDNSTSAKNVVANLVHAVHPAALILVSHSRKPHPEGKYNMMADHRGSSYITGRMDAIMRLTHNRLYYSGRSIEEGNIKLDRQENGLWLPSADENTPQLQAILADTSLKSLNAKGRALAQHLGLSESAAISRVRRAAASMPRDLKETINA